MDIHLQRVGSIVCNPCSLFCARVGNVFGWEHEIPLEELHNLYPQVFSCQPLSESKIDGWIETIAQSLPYPSSLLKQISVLVAELTWLERQYIFVLTAQNIETKATLSEEKINRLHGYLEAVERARTGAFLMYRIEAAREINQKSC